MKVFRSAHAAYALSYHFVFVTKYRKPVLDARALDLLGTVLTDLALRMRGKLMEFNGEADHVHLLVSLPPDVSPLLAPIPLKRSALDGCARRSRTLGSPIKETFSGAEATSLRVAAERHWRSSSNTSVSKTGLHEQAFTAAFPRH